MKTFGIAIIGLLAGLLAAGFLFDRGPGIGAAQVALALACAAVAAGGAWLLRRDPARR